MPRPSPALALVLPLALAGAAALPSAAGAVVTADVLLECHSNSPLGSADEPIEVGLTGGRPGAAFRLVAARPGRPAGSVGSVAGNFDADGAATARITRIGDVGRSVSAGRVVVLSLQDASGALTPVAETRVTNFTADVAVRPSRLGARRIVRASGTPFAGATLSAFLVRGSGSKVLRRIGLGTANACGHVRRSVAILPRGLRPGAYRVYVGPGTRLRRTDAVYDRVRVR
jgi:hypothetical protein